MNIEIFQIARSQPDKSKIDKWLKYLGVEEYDFPQEELVSNPALTIAMAAKRCYLSFEEGLNPNVTKVRKNWVDYFDNILKSGHGSVLEHSVFTFAIEGVTRVFTAEMNRHRAGWAISEGSLRYIRFDDHIPYWEPISIQTQEGDSSELAEQKRRTREIFARSFNQQLENYKELEQIWDLDNKPFSFKKEKTSMFRRIVGLGVSTGGVWSGNVRALRHVLAMRCSEHAEEEICYVFSQICEKLVEEEPLLFGDFERVNGFYQPTYKKV